MVQPGREGSLAKALIVGLALLVQVLGQGRAVIRLSA
jgi:hypothetical protein